MSMTADRWERVQELFQLALEWDVHDRDARLAAECLGDESLREEVESLLSSGRSAHEFLNAAVRAAMDSYGMAATISLDTTAPSSAENEFHGNSRFAIQRRLGAGGFGTVYEAFDRERNTVVALKSLHRLDARSLLSFKREFRALADISHPNLVTLYELIADGQQCFFTMELIEGVHFREYVRDENLLRAALVQLVEGVSALHAAHKLHRDLKPSNVLVTSAGRLAILDFGLIADTTDRDFGRNEVIAGTPEYMSPEQGTGIALSEASDWYATGVMLYEAITGQRPSKFDPEPPAPSELMPGCARDLNDLCMDLLQKDPQSRPGGDEIRARLGMAPTAAISRKTPFVGRDAHLQYLSDAFESTMTGHAAAILIHGSSGIGKTALAQCFLERLSQSRAAVILAGRCYEQESLSYKAIDGVIDALSGYLKTLSQQLLHEVVPDISALARMFPVLSGVAAASARPAEQDPADLQEQRRRGVRTLRELFSRLARIRPIVVFIDDLQWGDSDSANLLAELLRPPDAPALLLIGCYRAEESGTSPFLRTLSSLEAGRGAAHSTQMALDELPPMEARVLLSALLDTPAGDPSGEAESIARCSGGNPFLITELARYAGSKQGFPQEAKDTPTLDDMVRVRVSTLPDAARRFLELIAVAGQPIDSGVVRSASGTQNDRGIVAVLRTLRLIRARITSDGQELEAYHDRIRETISAGLSSAETRELHLLLARALQSCPRQRPDLLAIHFAGGGRQSDAFQYAIVAAEQAFSTLAFDTAARFYRMALTLQPAESDRAGPIRRKLGDALSNAGRGAEAAEAYLAAAGSASSLDALEDRRRAAWQYLISGHVDDGRRELQAVVGAIGMKLAQTPRSALVSLLIGRARINLRGLRFLERPAAKISQKELIRIDTCWSVAHGLGMVDTICAAGFHARYVVDALRAGEKYRAARALAVEAAYHALSGTRRQNRTREVLGKAIELAETCENPHALALTTLVSGISAFLEGRWKSARELLARAETVLLERCVGTVWELATARLMWSTSSFFLGELNELNQRLPALLADADSRGDLYEATALRTRIAHPGPLAADDSQAALEIASGAIAKWSVQGFHIQHWWNLIAQSEILLYQGRGMSAWSMIEAQWPALKRSLLLHNQYLLIESLYHRAGSALALATDPRASNRSRLLGGAERDAARIERERALWGNALAMLIRAGLAGANGERQRASRLFESAENALDSMDMRLYAAAARRRRGMLIPGGEGTALVTAADQLMRAQGIRNPERFAEMLAPGRSAL